MALNRTAAKKKSAIIIGVNGQDGKILFEYLSRFNYALIGLGRKTLKTKGTKWNKKINITKKEEVYKLIKSVQPDEIYYLAAWHHSSEKKISDETTELRLSQAIHVDAFINFLEGIKLYSSKTKIFYASSSLIFGNNQQKKQSEKTPYRPIGIYAQTKMAGTLLCKLYREKYNIFAAAGILYNHESEYRADNFVSLKIIKGALKIKNKEAKKLVLGNLSAKVDWGYAPDYARAMHEILNLKQASDFIISSGQAHSVLDFVKITFSYLGLDYKKFVVKNKKIIASPRPTLIGDNKKLRQAIKWQPSVNFAEMIKTIVDKLNK